jgi:hypothetical protein
VLILSGTEGTEDEEDEDEEDEDEEDPVSVSDRNNTGLVDFFMIPKPSLKSGTVARFVVWTTSPET